VGGVGELSRREGKYFHDLGTASQAKSNRQDDGFEKIVGDALKIHYDISWVLRREDKYILSVSKQVKRAPFPFRFPQGHSKKEKERQFLMGL